MCKKFKKYNMYIIITIIYKMYVAHNLKISKDNSVYI